MKHPSYTIQSLREGYLKKEFTPQEIFQHYTQRIEKENTALRAYLSVFQWAEQGWEQRNMTDDCSLFGIPIAFKDNMLVEHTIATGGSHILKNYVSAYDATAVARLKSAGALVMGKTNMDEFAMGSSTENSAFGVTRNPHDHHRVPGGSSGGSAAAVAADLAVCALGSDTGGSIRQPAGFCGVVGVKPSYGRVSRHGLMAMASSLDQIGPFTKTVKDAADMLEILCGQDPYDATTVPRDVPSFSATLDAPIKGLRIGIPKEYMGAGLDAEVKERVDRSLALLEEAGCTLVDVSLPHSAYALAVYYIVMPSEVSSNLSRFDGIRYGHSARGIKDLLEVYRQSRAEGFGAEPKRRIMLGAYALSSGYYDAYYLKAQKVRALIRKDFDDAFKHVDVIVGPTSPTTAFKIGEKSSDPLSMYLSDIYTVPVNLAGLPALSLPCGMGAESHMPVGFHIIAPMFDEATMLRVAHHLEYALQ